MRYPVLVAAGGTDNGVWADTWGLIADSIPLIARFSTCSAESVATRA